MNKSLNKDPNNISSIDNKINGDISQEQSRIDLEIANAHEVEDMLIRKCIMDSYNNDKLLDVEATNKKPNDVKEQIVNTKRPEEDVEENNQTSQTNEILNRTQKIRIIIPDNEKSQCKICNVENKQHQNATREASSVLDLKNRPTNSSQPSPHKKGTCPIHPDKFNSNCLEQNEKNTNDEKVFNLKRFISHFIKRKNKAKNIISYRFIHFKREDINKNILRRFKKYVRSNKSQFESSLNLGLLKYFLNKNILPPISFTLDDEIVEFRSFNSSYISWLFSHPGVKEVFSLFLDEHLEEFIKDIEIKLKSRGLDKETVTKEISVIRNYLSNFNDLYFQKTNANVSCIYQRLVDSYKNFNNQTYYQQNIKTIKTFTQFKLLRSVKEIFKITNDKELHSKQQQRTIQYNEFTDNPHKEQENEKNYTNVNIKIENIFNENSKENLKRDCAYFSLINNK